MQERRDHRHRESFRHAVWGWILFLVCALFFIAASWRNRDFLTLIGSLVFFGACLFFLVPLLRAARTGKDDRR